MKRPNGSGSVIKLSGKRRRPYAVRIFDGYKERPDGQITPKYKYVSYHEKQSDALRALEKYNASPVTLAKEIESTKKHKFSEIYEMWQEELDRRSKPLSSQTQYAYQAAYNNLKPLHDMVFERITLEDLESAALANSSKSLSTITNIKIVLKSMYKTAMRHKFVSEDISALMILEHQDKNSRPHKIFTDDEIQVLWEHKSDYYAKILLILIYTGMRIKELLILESKDVHLNERYLVGGVKTNAGKNRIIPISEKIVPLVDTSKKYLIMDGSHSLQYSKANTEVTAYLKSLNMAHKFHDTRHTCATLLERANISELHRKLILGHASVDVTSRYTHVSKEQLINDINQI